ncbi:MAG TPA: UDP-2,3-diacylglucosamine diphosphatase [Verrucomicrobiae bacterium]|nr:UDP-2,3-diacylglucosamine diphosphatase [Verrucomicrobiae bacterium]
MHYKTVWISDLHLGTRGCDALGLLDFLRQTDFENLYLVGDVVDIWHLKKDHYWPQTHNDVVQKILRKARKGANVVVIPGNHDEFCRNFLGNYGNVSIQTQALYITISGQRLLVLHGHEFDTVAKHARWLAYLGDAGYSFLLKANGPLNALRRRFGLNYWSLSAYAKSKVKNAVKFISQFETAVVQYAQMYAADGVICGHIHTPAVKQIRGVAYFNVGDWVESNTALVEHLDGRMELVHWRSSPSADEISFPLDAADQSELLVAKPELAS